MTSKQIDKAVEKSFYKFSYGVEIPMLALPKIFNIGKKALLSEQDIDVAIKAAIDEYKLK